MAHVIKKILALLAITFFIATPAMAADQAGVPLLTWENGKQHSVFLGGPGATDKWKVALEGENIAPYFFKPSSKDEKGFYIFSLDIPKDLAPGAYSVYVTKGNGTKLLLSTIQITQRQYYTLTEIPTDLRLLAIIFAGLTAIFTVARARKYSQLSFRRKYVGESKNFFYNFRTTRLASQGNSLPRYIALRDGEPLHRMSSFLWSILPVIGIPLGIATAIKIQFDAAIPNGPLYLFFICAALGALDATTGIVLALSVGFMHVALGNVSSVKDLVVAVTFTLAWYFPAMIGSLVKVIVRQDLERVSESAAKFLSTIVAALVGGASVVLSIILTNSLVINREASDLLRWPLAGTVAAVIALKFIFESATDKQIEDGRPETLFMARVVSPGLAWTIFAGTILLTYAWTEKLGSSLLASVIIAAPYILLFVIFPGLSRIARRPLPRNLFIEGLLVVLFTFGVYAAVQALPDSVVNKSRAFILVGLIPSFLHAIYSLVLASAEHVAHSDELKEMEAVA